MRLPIRLLIVSVPVMLAMLACMLPGMIPLSAASQPDMETNTETLIETLNGENWVALSALTAEQYTEEDYSKPGTLTFTAEVNNEKPVYFSYGWCTVDEETLQQNFEHITVTLSLNGNELGENKVHSLIFTRPDGLVCADFGVLLSNWEPGEYELKAVAVFDEVINDGLADYDPGDYEFVYNVTCERLIKQSRIEANSEIIRAEDRFDFGFAVDLMRKDLRIALEEARANGARLPVAALVDQFYSALQSCGGGRLDTSSLIRLLRDAPAAP